MKKGRCIKGGQILRGTNRKRNTIESNEILQQFLSQINPNNCWETANGECWVLANGQPWLLGS